LVLRIIDLSPASSPSPPGAGDATARPNLVGYRWNIPYPNFIERSSTKRNFMDILSYFHIYRFASGPFPGEIFDSIETTTKPYGTYVSYYEFLGPSSQDWIKREVSQLPADQLIGDCVILDLEDATKKGVIDEKDFERFDNIIKRGDIVFIRTNYSEKYRKSYPSLEYYLQSPGITVKAAEWLVKKGVKCVGTDTRTLEPERLDSNVDVHYIFHSNGIPTFEDLTNLATISKERAFALCGIPAKIRGASGGIARVAVIEEGKIIDCSHEVETFPSKDSDPVTPYPYIGNPIMPEHIEPRELMNINIRFTRLTPFILEGEGLRGMNPHIEMYMRFTHGSPAHIEHAQTAGPYAPFMSIKYGVPEKIWKKFRKIPIEACIGEASLIDLTEKIGPRQLINRKHLDETGKHVKEGDIVLVRTGINDWYFYTETGFEITAGFTVEAAEWFVERGVKTLIIDFPAVEMSNPRGPPQIRYTANDVHYTLHRNGIGIVEGVYNMWLLRKERSFVAVLPVPVARLGASAAHVIVIENWD